MRITLSLLFVCLSIHCTYAQFTDPTDTSLDLRKSKKTETKTKKSFFAKRVIPISLIAGGVLLTKSDFEESLQKDLRGAAGKNFYTKIDDYTRYAPIAQMYVADVLGIEAKNHWFDQTKNLMLSTLLANATSTLLKKEVDKKRPGDSTQNNSFPSGHTTTAFATASVLYEEFIDTSPTLAYSGYIFAITTASLRMLNNKHYFSDVLVGAGIGILSTQLVYQLEHLIKWNPFKNAGDISFAPQFLEGNLGFYLAARF